MQLTPRIQCMSGLTGDDVDNNNVDDGDGGQKIIIIKYPTLAVICEQLGNW